MGALSVLCMGRDACHSCSLCLLPTEGGVGANVVLDLVQNGLLRLQEMLSGPHAWSRQRRSVDYDIQCYYRHVPPSYSLCSPPVIT